MTSSSSLARRPTPSLSDAAAAAQSHPIPEIGRLEYGYAPGRTGKADMGSARFCCCSEEKVGLSGEEADIGVGDNEDVRRLRGGVDLCGCITTSSVGGDVAGIAAGDDATATTVSGCGDLVASSGVWILREGFLDEFVPGVLGVTSDNAGSLDVPVASTGAGGCE